MFLRIIDRIKRRVKNMHFHYFVRAHSKWLAHHKMCVFRHFFAMRWIVCQLNLTPL